MTARKTCAGLFLLFLMGGSAALLSQATTGTISGVVQDETGAVLPGVSVVIKNMDTGLSRSVVSNDEGRYLAPNLAVGRYEIQAELPGFRTEVRSGVTLSVGREAVVNFQMKLGEISERVVVTGEASLVETTSSAVAGLINQEQIRDLPLNGRDFVQLAALQQGVYLVQVVSKDATNRQSRSMGTRISVGGARDKQTGFILDGTAITDSSGGTPGGISGNNFGVDLVREFKVYQNAYSSEYGSKSGGVVTVVSRSGTNEFHGSVFEFHRNSALDARNFFDLDPSNPTVRSDPPSFRRNQFGFTVAGPIFKDKTFFIGSYEGFREGLGRTRLSRVPTPAAREGRLQDRTVAVSSLVRPYLEFIPLPNGQTFAGGETGEFITSTTKSTSEDYFTVRLDHNFSEADSLFGRYTMTDGGITDPTALLITSQDLQARNQYFSLEEKHIFSPSVLNVARIGLMRANSGFVTNELITYPEALLFNPGNVTGKIGALQVPGWTQFTFGGGDVNPRFFIQNRFQVNDTVTLSAANHVLKIGTDIQRIHDNTTQNNRPGALVSHDSIEQFLTARPRRAEGQLPGSDGKRGWRQTMVGIFLQDDWRWRPNFTWNLGLRYEFITLPEEVNGKSSSLINKLTDTQPTLGPLFLENPSLNNFAPRLGFAWDPTGGGKSSIRAGFGIFFDLLQPHYYLQEGSLLWPFVVIGARTNPPFPRVYEGFTRDSIPLSTQRLNVLDPTPNQPYRMQYNLTLQREVAPGLVLTAGYVGSRSVHNVISYDAGNNALPTIQADGRKFFPAGLRRRNPVLGPLRDKRFDGDANYHSFQLGATKSLSSGFSFQLNYTVAKSVDTGSALFNTNDYNNTTDIPDPDDLRQFRGLSDFDVRQHFVVNFTYELPFGPGKPLGGGLTGAAAKILGGWQVNGIVSLDDGSPFTPLLLFDRARSLPFRQGGDQRPQQAPNGNNNPVLGGPDKYFDPLAFDLPPVGFFGDVGRNTIIGPGVATFDFSLFKNTRITEAINLQFRVEAFNLLNRANFGDVASDVFDARGRIASAGRISDTSTTGRQIQFGLKLVF